MKNEFTRSAMHRPWYTFFPGNFIKFSGKLFHRIPADFCFWKMFETDDKPVEEYM